MHVLSYLPYNNGTKRLTCPQLKKKSGTRRTVVQNRKKAVEILPYESRLSDWREIWYVRVFGVADFTEHTSFDRWRTAESVALWYIFEKWAIEVKFCIWFFLWSLTSVDILVLARGVLLSQWRSDIHNKVSEWSAIRCFFFGSLISEVTFAPRK